MIDSLPVLEARSLNRGVGRPGSSRRLWGRGHLRLWASAAAGSPWCSLTGSLVTPIVLPMSQAFSLCLCLFPSSKDTSPVRGRVCLISTYVSITSAKTIFKEGHLPRCWGLGPGPAFRRTWLSPQHCPMARSPRAVSIVIFLLRCSERGIRSTVQRLH